MEVILIIVVILFYILLIKSFIDGVKEHDEYKKEHPSDTLEMTCR